MHLDGLDAGRVLLELLLIDELGFAGLLTHLQELGLGAMVPLAVALHGRPLFEIAADLAESVEVSKWKCCKKPLNFEFFHHEVKAK